MARLGEQLIAAGTVSADKVEQALRAQVVWGARLGTNLIELGCIDLDELSRALGQLHGVPAALARHFDKADPELQSLLSQDLARQFSVVPLVRLSPDRIAVVALDPLGAVERDLLGEIYGVDPINGIVTSVAAEMRVLYHLERVYQIPRPTRYLRQKGANVTPFPTLDMSFEIDIDVEPEIVGELAPIEPEVELELDVDAMVEVEEPRPATPSGSMPAIDLAEASALLEAAMETTPAPAVDPAQPAGRERRTYLKTLADDGSAPSIQIPEKRKSASIPPLTIPAPPAPTGLETPTARAPSFDAPTVSAPAAIAEALRADIDRPSQTDVLGRIAIRRVAVNQSTGSIEKVEKQIQPTNFIDSTRAIKRGPNRDRVAELVIETLDRYVPSCNAALLLVIRGDVAIGWKHFSREEDGTSEVAVPLDQDGIVPTAISRKTTTRLPTEELNSLDVRLLRAVGNGDGSDLAVFPIMIADQVMCLLAAATAPEAELAQIEAIASAASAAFARLIRDASR